MEKQTKMNPDEYLFTEDLIESFAQRLRVRHSKPLSKRIVAITRPFDDPEVGDEVYDQ